MHINRKFLAVCRTIHIYLTMFGIFVMLLFSVTGFTINHEGWFNATTPHVTERTGTTPTELITQNDPVFLVEHLRQTYKISAALKSYKDSDEQIRFAFKSPHEAWDIEIDKTDGSTRIQLEASNFVALVNNLHRGRYAGKAWTVVIDISALLIVIASATGVVLWLVLPKRRTLGLVALVSGFVVVGIVYWLMVPGSDLAMVR